MAEPLDLQAVLQNGYFTTSRAKSVQASSPPRFAPPPLSQPRSGSVPSDSIQSSKALELRRSKVRPPPPTVEDEVDALAKEFGALSAGDPAPDQVQSRGEFEQYPIILEVHEHNPERRFVLVPEGSAASDTAAHKDAGPEPEEEGQSELPQPEAQPAPSRREEPRSGAYNAPAQDDRPPSPRRRSRQDLPPLNTTVPEDARAAHKRARSAVGSRHEESSARPSGRYGEEMLSPEVIKNGSSRREKSYYDYSASASGPRRMMHQRSYSNLADDRRRDKPHRRESLSPGNGSRSESNPDARKARRRSIDRPSESRHREELGGPRTTRREQTLPTRREDLDATRTSRPLGPRPRKEDSRSGDDHAPQSRANGRRRATSIHQDAPPTIPEKGPEILRDGRSRSRGPTVSTYPHTSEAPKNVPANPRASATFPILTDDTKTRLPYPDDVPTGRTNRPSAYSAKAAPTASMPDISTGASASPDKHPDNSAKTDPASAKAAAWPPSFVPERDGLPTEVEMGSYRRFSEGRAPSGVPGFPECQRKEPVAGKLDWLTLPRTDFNICPECYQGVFAKTEYRNLFQPMLRPMDRSISCDFGSSPWYRIAYLLTLKNEHPDLRLFHQVDSVVGNSRNQPCPGNRKALRNWYAIRDPYKRRMVPNFTACLQCAKMVEVLLPNLMGIFIPVDARPEPVSSVCALHFRPHRKRFAYVFDTLETTADKAIRNSEPPDVSALASKIERLCAVEECREDTPIPEAYWHTMQFLPQLTVCSGCFEEVVRPRLGFDSLARNFYKEPQKLQLATCQLYSQRMRDIFKKACKHDDAKLLKAKVIERLQVEADIHAELVKLDRGGHDDAWTEEQVSRLIQEWKRWE